MSILCYDILGLIGDEVSVIRAQQKHREQTAEICRVIDGAQETAHHREAGLYWSPGMIDTGFIGKPFGHEVVDYMLSSEPGETPEGSVYLWCFTKN